MNKAARYERIYQQISALMQKSTDMQARMATVCAVLYHKMPYFFWTGIRSDKTIIVADVHQFEGHIACDSRSKSEIVVPIHNHNGAVLGVLDVDSESLNSFDESDAEWLEKTISLITKL